MARDLPTGMATALALPTVSPVFLVKIEWPTGTVYAWNGYGEIIFDGNTYSGTGLLGTISEIRESRDGTANGVQLKLSGIPSGMIALALSGESQGKPAKVYFGLLDATAGFTITPYLVFDGVVDVCPIEDSGETASITVQLEKELIDNRTRGRRYTHEDQQIDFPGDLGFEYVAGLQNKEVTWGKAVITSAVAPGSSRTEDNEP